MKISEIINELTELQQYIGDKELEACIANAAMTGVNIMYQNDDGGITSTSLDGEKMAKLIKETTSDQVTHDENMETHDMNANRLQTEERKIHWLENEIKDLEYALSSNCINRNLKLNQLQMYREFLAINRERQNDRVKQMFVEMFETSIKTVIDDSLDKIETACVTTLDKFCQQMDTATRVEQ